MLSLPIPPSSYWRHLHWRCAGCCWSCRLSRITWWIRQSSCWGDHCIGDIGGKHGKVKNVDGVLHAWKTGWWTHWTWCRVISRKAFFAAIFTTSVVSPSWARTGWRGCCCLWKIVRHMSRKGHSRWSVRLNGRSIGVIGWCYQMLFRSKHNSTIPRSLCGPLCMSIFPKVSDDSVSPFRKDVGQSFRLQSFWILKSRAIWWHHHAVLDRQLHQEVHLVIHQEVDQDLVLVRLLQNCCKRLRLRWQNKWIHIWVSSKVSW